MPQNFTDDVFNSAHVAQNDLQNIENNFTAVKSNFSGATSPSNPVAFMWWGDTTNHLLKIRNEANTAWISIVDLANSQLASGMVPDGSIVEAKIGTGAVTENKIGSGAVTENKIGSGAVSSGKLASGAALANIGTGGVTETYLGAASVAQSKLKTSYGEVMIGYASYTNVTLPGGEYGFYPQIKAYGGSIPLDVKICTSESGTGTSYVTNIAAYALTGSAAYAKQRYVTSSGEVFWVFIHRDKTTKEVKGAYASPDHPCFGNSGKPKVVPHPFPSYDPEKEEVVVVFLTKRELDIIDKKCDSNNDGIPDRSRLEVILEDYTLETDAPGLEWPKMPITVGLPNGHDWQAAYNQGKEVTPIKKVIPKPKDIVLAKLKKK